jgi:hypothetical protein
METPSTPRAPINTQKQTQPTDKVTGDDVKRETKEAVDAAAKLAAQKKQEYQRELEKKLADLDQQIDAWKAKASKATAEAKVEMDKKLVVLKEKRDAVAQKMKELGDSTSAAWADVKVGIEKAYDELKDAVENAKDNFK